MKTVVAEATLVQLDCHVKRSPEFQDAGSLVWLVRTAIQVEVLLAVAGEMMDTMKCMAIEHILDLDRWSDMAHYVHIVGSE